MSQQDMDLPAEPRVAWDSDGEAWEEIIAENGEPTGVFKARVPDGDGDELTLGQLDQQAAVVVAGGFSLPLCAVHPEVES